MGNLKRVSAYNGTIKMMLSENGGLYMSGEELEDMILKFRQVRSTHRIPNEKHASSPGCLKKCQSRIQIGSKQFKLW